MIHFSKEKIDNLDKIYRLNLINSCTGYKSANLLGTIDSEGNTNVAVFSSITHLGSNPAMIGFVLRPRTVPRNTYNNMFKLKYFTVNHINANDIEDAHHTSAKYPKEISEFDQTNLEAEYLDDFIAPFVKSSKIKLACKYLNEYDIKENDTILVVASIEGIYVEDGIIQDDGWLRLDNAKTVAINGLDGYAETKLIERFEYARPKKMSDIVNNKIEDYIRKNSSKEPEILKDLNKETHLKVLNPRMLSGHIQGRFLSIITKLIKPKKILEIGTYTGYSAICMAEGLIEKGIIHTIDINEELVSIQNKYFAKSKCNNSIIQHVGDARSIIKSINEKFDLVFLDADKENYIEYYELVIEKVKKGGLIIADNVLWTGKVVEPKKDDDELTQYLIDFNKMINEDDRVENIILPLRDGLNVILKN